MSGNETKFETISSAVLGMGKIAAFGPDAGTAIGTIVSLAKLAGFVADERATFGPENQRVQKHIREQVLAGFKEFARAEGESVQLSGELSTANIALKNSLQLCFVDRRKLAACANDPKGFRIEAKAMIFETLEAKYTHLFAPDKSNTIGYRFAEVVVSAALHAALENHAYFRTLEPHLQIQMARRLAVVEGKVDAVHDDVKVIKDVVTQLKPEAEKAGVSEEFLVGLVQRYIPEISDIGTAIKEILNALQAAADLKAQSKLPTNFDEAINAVLERVAQLNDQGDFDAGQRTIDDELAAMDEEDERRKAGRLKLLTTAITQARIRRSVDDAVRYILAQVELEFGLGEAASKRLFEIRGEWFERGRDKGLNFDLEVVVSLDRHLVESTDSDQQPLKWATYLANSSAPLHTLGYRETNNKYLYEGVKVNLLALRKFSKSDNPLEWGTTINNLGNALSTIGEREEKIIFLKMAAVAHRKSLSVWNRSHWPEKWAMAQGNLANVFLAIGVKFENKKKLTSSYICKKKSLLVYNKEDHPFEWALAQNGKGVALNFLGQILQDPKILHDAETSFTSAISVWTKKKWRLDWAGAQLNLANLKYARMIMQNNSEDPSILESHRSDALSHVEKALIEFGPESSKYFYEFATELREKILAYQPYS